MALVTVCLGIKTGAFVAGCANPPTTNHARTYRSSQMFFSSEIIQGTKKSDSLLSSVDINVVVKGSGDPLGYSAYSNLWLYGWNPSANDTWYNFGGEDDGWPTEYTVKAEYHDDSTTSGTVTVTVTVSDFSHPSSGTIIYRNQHSLRWE